jgi:hypothetical protein
MTTKAELFRWLAERPSWRPGPRPAPAEEAPPPLRPARPPRAGRKATYALETGGGRRSRKSTRRSANRQKTDVQFRMKRRVGEARAQDRARP